METLLYFFPKRGEDGKMATVPKGRFRKFTSSRTKLFLRKTMKVVVLTLVVVLLYRWSQRRRFAPDATDSEGGMLKTERQVEGLRVLEVRRIEDEDPMSVYDQIVEPLPREGMRTGDAGKEERLEGEAALTLGEKAGGNGEITDTENKKESDNLWDTETSDVKTEMNEENHDAAAKESNPPEENIAPNAIAETEKEETEKKTTLSAEGKDNTTNNTELPPQGPERNASSASNALRASENEHSETREASNDLANESLAVDAIEGTIGKLKDAIGGIKMKLDEMKPPSKLYYRGYENLPQSPAMMVPGSPSTGREPGTLMREPAVGFGDLAGRFTGVKDDLIFGHRETGNEKRDGIQSNQEPFDLQQRLVSPWGWACVGGKCVKQEKGFGRVLSTLNVCKLTCGSYGSLWPRPTGVTRIGESTISFLFKNLTLEAIRAHDDGESLVRKVFDIFVNNLAKEHGHQETAGQVPPEVFEQKVSVSIVVSGSDSRLALETPEAYTLDVVTQERVTKVSVFALSVFGARHGLETLSQLIAFDEDEGVFRIVSSVTLSDAPAFKYRGILLDTSRNFFSVKSIERTLDAMAANKLNTFHWHITDSHSFPLYLEALPKMASYGAYSPQQVYYPDDVRHLVEYGRVRGIRVLPEFDVPAHVGNGWQWAEKQGLGKLVVCLNKEPWHSYCAEPPCGQLNVVNNNTYSILSKIYEEMVSLFGPLDFFHFGGDEVNLNCWNTTEEIVKHMEEQGRGRDADAYYKLWSDFQERAYGLLTAANKGQKIPGILWTSELTLNRRAAKYLDPTKYIIQIWTTKDDAVIRELLEDKFRVIFTNYDHWYLDCGFGAWVGEGNNWCSPYKGWQKVYDNSPFDIATDLTGSSHSDLVLGGEAALWGEQVDDMTLDSRLWPRGAALAERLWTNPSHKSSSAAPRLVHHRQRMVSRGVGADRVQPEWCHQNEGHCY